MAQLKVNNQPNQQSVTLPTTNGIKPTPYGQAYRRAIGGTVYLQDRFGDYNPPTIPVRAGPSAYGAPLPNNRFPINAQRSLPIYMGNDGSPQGSAQQLQPQFGRTVGGYGIWHVPAVPLLRQPMMYST